MKNPIAYFKHLVKDPVTTIPEADARKKELLPWLIGSIATAVICCVLDGFLNTGFLMVIGMIGIFATMFFGFLLSMLGKIKAKFKALTCDKCNTLATLKTEEDFAKFVSYTASGDVASYIGINHPGTNNGIVSKVEATGNAKAVVKIQLKCPECGNVKELEYRITPFKCSAVEEKVRVLDIEAVKARLERNVKEAIADYNDPDKKVAIPYSIHSSKNPNYENRGKMQVGTSWIPRYNTVRIDYRKDVDEMVKDFFINNQVDGTIIDLSKKNG